MAGNGIRIVVTGGPGGGKSTAVDLFRREIGESVVVVPEAATMLFSGGFPRTDEPVATRYAQRAIYHVQRSLEGVYRARFPQRALICDRGTIDGAAYWRAEGDGDFFESMGTTIDEQYARYDAVLFFESAAVGGIRIEGGNPIRTEDIDAAVSLDRRLRELWCRHPRFTVIEHDPSFIAKIQRGLDALRELVDGHDAS